ncbi:hypothetical protein Val02_65600 [Virgisporangium aliadipatigenens]|uniref:YwqJ-like deaminase n=1 Tax=Virgisporangium aliadipatigenens TaxID=741659 RepID=A0A8J4DTD6_9ACTN|nr:hypothetical protein [Virgisporangium aliadipatigenens]GIJ49674.1 hypothetical protein Val02_65600 [Virgisporangium aliadipatigenens]
MDERTVTEQQPPAPTGRPERTAASLLERSDAARPDAAPASLGNAAFARMLADATGEPAGRMDPQVAAGLAAGGNRAMSGLLSGAPATEPAVGVDARAAGVDAQGVGAEAVGVDAQAEVSREAGVQGPTAADVSEPAPAEQIAQQGAAAVQSLGQVAAQAAGPPPPVAPLYTPEPLPPADPGTAAATDVAAPAAEAAVRKDVALAEAGESAAGLDGVRSSAASFAGASVGFGVPATADGAQRSAAASDQVSSFLTAVGERAAAVTDLGTVAADRYREAARAGVEQINLGVEERLQAVHAHLATLRAQAQSQADAARGTVEARHATARSTIADATAAARLRLENDHNAALLSIEAQEGQQLQALDRLYEAGDRRFRAAGQTVGGEAATRGTTMAEEYMRGLVDEDDSFWDGPLTYNRGKARADTAREISKAYHDGLIDEANKQADQALSGKARDIESVHATAGSAREALRQQHTATLDTLQQADTAALEQADAARTALLDAITQALTGGQQLFDRLEVSLVENIRTSAQAQTAAVEQQAFALTGAAQEHIARTANGLLEAGGTLAAQAQGAVPPPVDTLVALLGAATAEIDAGVTTFHQELEESLELGAGQLSDASFVVTDGLATSTQQGLDGATTDANDLGATIQAIADSAAGTFETIEQQHDSGLTRTTTTAKEGYDRVVDGVRQTYGELSRGLEQGFERSGAGLEQGLRGALTKMETEIRTRAEENAAAVPPRWKSVVKWVLIIAVIVVVALVIGPFVIGAVGAALGTGAVMTGIIAGAIVGAATGATMQVINNWASNRPLGEGVLKAAVIGGIGGAVGGGFGAYFASAAQAGTTVVNTAFRQFLANTAIGAATETVLNVVTTGHFSWEALGMSLLSAVVVGAAMHGAGGLKGVQGIQEGAIGAGEKFGGALRAGMGGTVSINYRPTGVPEGTTRQGTEADPASGLPGAHQSGDGPAAATTSTADDAPRRTTTAADDGPVSASTAGDGRIGADPDGPRPTTTADDGQPVRVVSTEEVPGGAGRIGADPDGRVPTDADGVPARGGAQTEADGVPATAKPVEEPPVTSKPVEEKSVPAVVADEEVPVVKTDTESTPPSTTEEVPPRKQRAWVHPDGAKKGHFVDIDENVPVEYRAITPRSEEESAAFYADAMKNKKGGNPATAVVMGENGPNIRDNLYTGDAQTKAVKVLQEQGILEILPDDHLRVTDPEKYLAWIEEAYAQRGNAHMSDAMREAIEAHISSGPIKIKVDLKDGGMSNAGNLPGTHAEILALNDILLQMERAATTSGTVKVHTVRPDGSHFRACAHCSAIIERLPPAIRVQVLTGTVLVP